MTAVPLRTTRREALVGGLAVLATAGCEAVSPAPPEGSASRTTPSSASGATDDPDEALVDDVRSDLAEAWLLITSAQAARPGLRAELAPLATLHARHLRALEGDRPRGTRAVRGNATEVRTTVRAREAGLEASLASAALAARSGPLAALLASMSAAVAQQLAAQA